MKTGDIMFNIVFILVVLFLIIGVFVAMWKLSKWLVVPIQIILFILLITMAFKVFVTKENVEMLNKELGNSKIVQVETKALSGALDAFTSDKKEESGSEAKSDISSAEDTAKPSAPAEETKQENEQQENASAQNDDIKKEEQAK